MKISISLFEAQFSIESVIGRVFGSVFNRNLFSSDFFAGEAEVHNKPENKYPGEGNKCFKTGKEDIFIHEAQSMPVAGAKFHLKNRSGLQRRDIDIEDAFTDVILAVFADVSGNEKLGGNILRGQYP